MFFKYIVVLWIIWFINGDSFIWEYSVCAACTQLFITKFQYNICVARAYY